MATSLECPLDPLDQRLAFSVWCPLCIENSCLTISFPIELGLHAIYEVSFSTFRLLHINVQTTPGKAATILICAFPE